MKGKQRKLFNAGGLELQPPAGISGPRLWVRRLVIWRKPGEPPVRDIELHKGLNVVWSPDPAEKSAKTNSLGHGAGKTLFCTLLRYCLGEDSFAPETQRNHIGNAFNDGYVGAEVVLDGTPWAILRPIGNRRKHFAVPNRALEDLLNEEGPATGLKPFTEAAQSAILTSDVAGRMPVAHADFAWQAALAAITRDQGCHLSDVLDWRDVKSDSRSPVRDMSKEQRLTSLRLLIGAFLPEEQELADNVSRCEVDRANAERDCDWLARAVRRLTDELVKKLKLDPAALPPAKFGIAAIEKAAQENLKRVQGKRTAGVPADLDSARRAYKDANAEVVELTRGCGKAETAIALASGAITQAEAGGISAIAELDAAGNAVCPICRVPIGKVLAQGCGISLEPCNAIDLRRRVDSTKSDLERAKASRAQHIAELRDLKEELQLAESKAELINGQLEALVAAHERASKALREAEYLTYEAAQLKSTAIQHEKALRSHRRVEAKVEELRGRAGAFRAKHQDVFDRFSSHIRRLVKQLLGDQADGTSTLDGNGLHVTVDYGGVRTSAAIEALKVWAADLAILCLSIEGRTKLPAFLIHDSPRESDLGQSIYERTFAVAQQLEGITKEPLFQYIVTTTSEPPKAMRTTPYCVLKIHGAPASERLLKTDL